jgi:hypothetical protein
MCLYGLAELAPPLRPRAIKVDRLVLKMPVRLGPMANNRRRRKYQAAEPQGFLPTR